LLVACVGIAALSAIWGFALGTVFHAVHLTVELALLLTALLGVFAFSVYRWVSTKMDAVDRERMSWRRGALGELLTTEILKSLPDSYVVISDVTKKLGNIDQVVVGPTGVYVIDVKNWKGTVKADGKG